jgi:predicted nucleic acid-binding protein
MSRIFWDSNIFIYLFEDYGPNSDQVASMRERMLERGDRLITSALTIGEVTVKARRNGQLELSQRYEDAIVSSGEVVPFDLAAARVYAKIRSDQTRNVRPADAIQMACAAIAGTDLFVTNDKKLHNIRVPGIHFITSVERIPI